MSPNPTSQATETVSGSVQQSLADLTAVAKRIADDDPSPGNAAMLSRIGNELREAADILRDPSPMTAGPGPSP
jgi:hypothetical protein